MSELDFSECLQDASKVHFLRSYLGKEPLCLICLCIPKTWNKPVT